MSMIKLDQTCIYFYPLYLNFLTHGNRKVGEAFFVKGRAATFKLQEFRKASFSDIGAAEPDRANIICRSLHEKVG